MKYFWAMVAFGVMILVTPPFKTMWDSYAPGIIGSTELTVFEQMVVNYFPYIFVAICLIIIFIGLKGRGEKKG